MDILALANWRYATKRMLPGESVAPEKVNRILEAARMAPSSSGLQPYEILVVSDPALKAQIQPVAKNQPQIVECSHLLVFAAWDHYTPERMDGLYERTNRDRGNVSEYFTKYITMLKQAYLPRPAETNFQHAARQAYVGLGFALLAAAAEGVDSTPMEGFDPDALDQLLGLRAKGLRSVLLMPLGYRDVANDYLANQTKTRRQMDEFVTELK